MQEEQPSSSSDRERGYKSVANIIKDTTNAFCEGTNEEIRHLIEEWEVDLNR